MPEVSQPTQEKKEQRVITLHSWLKKYQHKKYIIAAKLFSSSFVSPRLLNPVSTLSYVQNLYDRFDIPRKAEKSYSQSYRFSRDKWFPGFRKILVGKEPYLDIGAFVLDEDAHEAFVSFLQLPLNEVDLHTHLTQDLYAWLMHMCELVKGNLIHQQRIVALQSVLLAVNQKYNLGFRSFLPTPDMSKSDSKKSISLNDIISPHLYQDEARVGDPITLGILARSEPAFTGLASSFIPTGEKMRRRRIDTIKEMSPSDVHYYDENRRSAQQLTKISMAESAKDKLDELILQLRGLVPTTIDWDKVVVKDFRVNTFEEVMRLLVAFRKKLPLDFEGQIKDLFNLLEELSYAEIVLPETNAIKTSLPSYFLTTNEQETFLERIKDEVQTLAEDWKSFETPILDRVNPMRMTERLSPAAALHMSLVALLLWTAHGISTGFERSFLSQGIDVVMTMKERGFNVSALLYWEAAENIVSGSTDRLLEGSEEARKTSSNLVDTYDYKGPDQGTSLAELLRRNNPTTVGSTFFNPQLTWSYEENIDPWIMNGLQSVAITYGPNGFEFTTMGRAEVAVVEKMPVLSSSSDHFAIIHVDESIQQKLSFLDLMNVSLNYEEESLEVLEQRDTLVRATVQSIHSVDINSMKVGEEVVIEPSPIGNRILWFLDEPGALTDVSEVDGISVSYVSDSGQIGGSYVRVVKTSEADIDYLHFAVVTRTNIPVMPPLSSESSNLSVEERLEQLPLPEPVVLTTIPIGVPYINLEGEIIDLDPSPEEIERYAELYSYLERVGFNFDELDQHFETSRNNFFGYEAYEIIRDELIRLGVVYSQDSAANELLRTNNPKVLIQVALSIGLDCDGLALLFDTVAKSYLAHARPNTFDNINNLLALGTLVDESDDADKVYGGHQYSYQTEMNHAQLQIGFNRRFEATRGFRVVSNVAEEEILATLVRTAEVELTQSEIRSISQLSLFLFSLMSVMAATTIIKGTRSGAKKTRAVIRDFRDFPVFSQDLEAKIKEKFDDEEAIKGLVTGMRLLAKILEAPRFMKHQKKELVSNAELITDYINVIYPQNAYSDFEMSDEQRASLQLFDAMPLGDSFAAEIVEEITTNDKRNVKIVKRLMKNVSFQTTKLVSSIMRMSWLDLKETGRDDVFETIKDALEEKIAYVESQLNDLSAKNSDTVEFKQLTSLREALNAAVFVLHFSRDVDQIIRLRLQN